MDQLIVRNVNTGFSKIGINAPIDHKRLSVPENAIPYILREQITSQNLEKHGKRQDGREALEMRKIYLKTNVVSQAKGSAYIELGKTKVIVSVFDPREIPNRNEYSIKGELYCEFKFAPFSCKKRRSHQQDAQEKEYSVILRRALESTVCRQEFPNFQVDIYALVLENDGSALSAAICCSGVALAQAGVPMYDLVTSVSVGKQGDRIFVDPTYEEELACNLTPNIQKLTYGDLTLMLGNSILIDKKIKIGKYKPEENEKQSSGHVTTEKDDGGSVSEMDVDSDEKRNRKCGDVGVDENEVEEMSVPSEIDRGCEHGLLLMSILQTHQQVTEYNQTGSMDLTTLKSLTELLLQKNAEIAPVIKSFLIKYIEKFLQNENKKNPSELNAK